MINQLYRKISEMRKPNLFIVGAPKCGTTSLYEYLKQHPEICMSKDKEPMFFGRDILITHPTWGVAGKNGDMQWYMEQFEACGDMPVIGGATPLYLYSKTAASEIHNFAPDAKIVVMLRNPIEAAYSMYYENLFQGNEVCTQFEDALELEHLRRNGQAIPPDSYLITTLFYRDLFSFSTQLKRYQALFSPENIHIILFDDFKRHTGNVVRDMFVFLGINPDYEVNLEQYNPNMVIRSSRIRQLMRPDFRPKLYQDFLTTVRTIIPISIRTPFNRFIKGMNTMVVPRPPMKPETWEQLKHDFEDDVRELGVMLGLDLSHWLSRNN